MQKWHFSAFHRFCSTRGLEKNHAQPHTNHNSSHLGDPFSHTQEINHSQNRHAGPKTPVMISRCRSAHSNESRSRSQKTHHNRMHGLLHSARRGWISALSPYLKELYPSVPNKALAVEETSGNEHMWELTPANIILSLTVLNASFVLQPTASLYSIIQCSFFLLPLCERPADAEPGPHSKTAGV